MSGGETAAPAPGRPVDAVREYLDQPGLRRPLALARERMEQLGRAGGTVELSALSDEEASALGGLLGSLRRRRRPRPRAPFTLSLADLDAALRGSRFELALEDALALVGSPLDPLAARRERERQAIDALWEEALAHPLCARESAVRAWVEGLRASGALARVARSAVPDPASGAPALGARSAQPDPASGGPGPESGGPRTTDPSVALPVMRALLRDALALGASLPASPQIERGRLACQALGGDPHALDEGRALAGLLLGQLAARCGLERPREARERRRLWERFGVLTDPVSADVLTLGLRPPPGGGPLAQALGLMIGSHFKLTLGQLAGEQLSFEAGTVVHVCENPAVLVAAEARLGHACRPLVCIGGWPSSAADALLADLAAQGSELRYHGDFDWEGLRIAALVARRYGARPWRYDAASYRAALAAHPGRAQPLGGRPATEPDFHAELADAMREREASLQEEAVLDRLVEDLREAGRPGLRP